MMYKRRITAPVATSLMLIAAAGTAGGRTVVRAVAVAPITVDGDVSDWKDVPILYLDKGPRVTAIAHDDRYFYVTFRFSDPTLARRVLRTGAIVWINGKGKHNADFGLRYRGTQAVETALHSLEGSSDVAKEPMPPKGPPPGRSGDVAKETVPPQGPPPGNGAGPQRVPLGALEVMRSGVSASVIAEGATPDGPAAACQVKDGVFIYEFRVPLAEIAATAASVKAGKGDKLAVGFQMGGPTEAELMAMRERMRSEGGPPGGGPQGGFGGGPQGGFGGGPQGGFGGGPPGGFGGGPPGGFGGGAPGGFEGGRGGPGAGGPPPGGLAGRPKAEETTWLDVELVPASAAAAKSTPQER